MILASKRLLKRLHYPLAVELPLFTLYALEDPSLQRGSKVIPEINLELIIAAGQANIKKNNIYKSHD